MSTEAAIDAEVITAHEFAPPCEHSAHSDRHVPSESASYLIVVRCTACERTLPPYFICASGATHLLGSPGLRDTDGCRRRTPGVDAVVSLTPIGGAS